MKALTICQPYPHLILIGEKPVENRTWATDYRGPLLIHAGKSRAWLRDGDTRRAAASGHPLTFGAIVGRATLVDCMSLQRYLRLHPEHADHQHVIGPYCWVLEEPVRFEKPIPWRGALGLFDVPDEVLP